MFTNGLQTLGCVICVLAFILTVAMSAGSPNHTPFSISIQILSLGLYLTMPIGSVALAFRKDPGERALLFSLTLSAIAIGIGVVPIIAIFQNLGGLNPTLKDWAEILFFLSGYLTNIPALFLRTIPQEYILQRKKRGAPPGDWGNLNGIQVEMQTPKRGKFILYLVFFGILASFTLSRIALSSPSLILWFPFVILVAVSIIAITVYLRGGKSGWEQATLDTFENQTLWWYTGHGTLLSVLMKDPLVELQNELVKISLVKGGLATNFRFHSQAERHHFLTIMGLTGSGR